MKWNASKQRFVPMTMILWIAIVNAPCHAFEIEIKDNKISVQAGRVPLQDLLKQLATDFDISVNIDPSINPPITVSFKNIDLEDGLKTILRPHNHALFWKSNDDLTGNLSEPAYQLAQIHVFKPGQKEQMIDIKAPIAVTAPEKPLLPETKVMIKGNKVFVPVVLAYKDEEVQTTLLFDTGASSIVVHENIAEQLGIDEYQEAQGRGVGGLKINTRATNLSYVIVGPHKKENLRADLIEYQGPADESYNGLLGMNFIRGLKFTIDFTRQIIKWAPN